MITFKNVTKHYKSNIGIDNVSVKINKGDFVFLVGPSGAGKSTFIKLILKEIDADSGSIVVAGKDVTQATNRQVPGLRREVGIVFQDFRLLPKKTVFENVAFAMEIIHKSSREIKRQVPPILSLVGVGTKAQKYPDELSAGEQQRVAIARAIINRPDLLIADEPTGNLDPETAWEIMQLLDQINQTGTTIVMVTHAKDIVDRMNKRVIAIEKGRIVRDEFGAYGLQDHSEDLHLSPDPLQQRYTMGFASKVLQQAPVIPEAGNRKRANTGNKQAEVRQRTALKSELKTPERQHIVNPEEVLEGQQRINLDAAVWKQREPVKSEAEALKQRQAAIIDQETIRENLHV